METHNETSTVDERVVKEFSQDNEQLDAGALFVLQSKGSWVHCGYHLTTSIVGPALLTLPYTFTFLGWARGLICLIAGALITFYSYNLLSMVLEYNAHLGRRHLRFRDMAHDILGPRWGKYLVGPIQFAVCYAAVVGACLLGGQCMKAIYLVVNPNGGMKLYEFIIIFGGLMLILAQLPSFHSLRHVNFISLLLCLAYTAATTAASIYLGYTSKGSKKDYSINNNPGDRVFGMFNAVSIIATSYGNGIIPEIQIYLQPTNEVLEGILGDPKSEQFSVRNMIPRVIARSISVATAATISAMLPFFGDINGVFGAFGFIPLDFVLPFILFNLTFKPSKLTFIFWFNLTIALVFSLLALIASVSAVRQIFLDAKSYTLFANL